MGYTGRTKSKSRAKFTSNTVSIGPLNILFGGQSNNDGMFNSINSPSPGNSSGRGGANAFEAVFAQYLPNVQVVAHDCAVGGSAAIRYHNSAEEVGGNYWLDDDTGLFDGAPAIAFAAKSAQIQASGQAVHAIDWDQGETGMGTVSNSSIELARYKEGLLDIFAWMRSLVGNVPVFIRPIGSRDITIDGGSPVTVVGYQRIRELQKLLDTENDYIYLLPEKFDLENYGAQHYTAAAYATMGQRDAWKILNALGYSSGSPVDGPTISSVSRNGKIVTIGLTHASGASDFTPSSGITGFLYSDALKSSGPNGGATEVAISSVVRTNANTITLTLADYPRNTPEELFYLYNAYGAPSANIDKTKLVKDTSARALPLRAARIAPTVTDNSFKNILSSIVWQHDVFDDESYSGTGQVLYNIVAVPAGGLSKSLYNYNLGSGSSSDSLDPTYQASPKAFVNDGNDEFSSESIFGETFVKNWSISSQMTFAWFGKTPSSWTGTPIFIQNGGNAAGTAGLRLRYNSSGNRMELSTSDGTTLATLNMSGALPTNTNLALIFTYDGATKAYKLYINSTTPTFSGTNTAGLQATSGSNSILSFVNFPNGTLFRRDACFNTIASNAEVAALIAAANTKDSVTYV